ncbi:MAG TPA: serine hydrolase [Burkholderiales bacterium]|nr:serine hydrolase [Burkholderiales bacterium]
MKRKPLRGSLAIIGKALVPLLFLCSAPSHADVSFKSMHALVVDDESGEVLLEKNAEAVAPIASLTKLMTAMVILDAGQDKDALIRIEKADVYTIRHTGFGAPIGAHATRDSLLELMLMTSDNHAAMALARAYPGGFLEFKLAMNRKIRELGLNSTAIEEPTGLSPNNRASAVDVTRILRAASTYPEIVKFTTQSNNRVEVRGRTREYRNTNSLVGAPGWNILLSKTGFTNPAGRCVAMRMMTAGKTVTVVLLGAWSKAQRTRDALTVRQWLAQKKNSSVKSARHAPAPQFIQAVYNPASRSEVAAVKEDLWSLKMDASMGGLAQ